MQVILSATLSRLCGAQADFHVSTATSVQSWFLVLWLLRVILRGRRAITLAPTVKKVQVIAQNMAYPFQM